MNASLFSPNWHRVAGLSPRLRAHVRVQRGRSRDQMWTLLFDPAGRHQLRLNEAAYDFVGRCDGRHTVQRIWDEVLEQDGEHAPTQDEVIGVLTRLDEAGMLHIDQPLVDPEALFERERAARRKRLRAAVNPLAFKAPLGNPTRLLRPLDPLGRALLRMPMLLLWAAAVLVAALVAATHLAELSAHVNTLFGTPRFYALALGLFVLMKLIHECAHGVTVRHFGGDVADAGISLLLLVPAPYVDASAAVAFRSRGQRALVAGIGMMVELALAALGLALWMQVQPGLIRDAALMLMLIGSVSTLVFNGNPLLRFDAYYVLTDALDLPNLASRSSEYWRTLLQRYVLRADLPPFEIARGERKWLFFYGPASFAYRLALIAAVVVWVGAHSALLAAALAAFIGVAVLLLPAVRFVHATLCQLPPGRELRRAQWAGMTTVAVLAGAVFALPLPSYTIAQGVVWPPDQAQVRPAVDGFVREMHAVDGAIVEAGTLLLVLDNPELFAARARLRSRYESVQHERYAALLREPARAQSLAAEADELQAELDQIDEQIESLAVRAQVGGRLVMPRQDDLAGTLARRGVPLGYILNDADSTVRVAVAQGAAARVRADVQAVSVQLAESPAPIAATLASDVPAATRELPSPALGERGGGWLPVDPADADGRRSLESVFLFEVRLPRLPLERIGQRAWVRFDHGTEPLVRQWLRATGQVLLKRFNPST